MFSGSGQALGYVLLNQDRYKLKNKNKNLNMELIAISVQVHNTTVYCK